MVTLWTESDLQPRTERAQDHTADTQLAATDRRVRAWATDLPLASTTVGLASKRSRLLNPEEPGHPRDGPWRPAPGMPGTRV